MNRKRFFVGVFALLIFLGLVNLGLAAYGYFDEGKLNKSSIVIGISMFTCAIGVLAASKRKSK